MTITSPIEVWLTEKDFGVGCRIVADTEPGITSPNIDSVSMRGAQREVSMYLAGHGYRPVGRWKTEAENEKGNSIETSRQFKACG